MKKPNLLNLRIPESFQASSPKTDLKQVNDCLASFFWAIHQRYLYTSSAIKTGEAREKPWC
jgi:hypothetical protein